MNKSIRNKKQRKYRSKCKINSKKEQSRMVGSSLLSNNCKQQIFNIFNINITHNHNDILALKYIIYDLSKITPISLIKLNLVIAS